MYNDGTTILALIQSIGSAACFLGGITLITWSLTERWKTQAKAVEDSLSPTEEVSTVRRSAA